MAGDYLNEEWDVIIIGGGLSGMTAGWDLKKRCSHMKILILEAKDRLGGRTLTEELPTAHGKDAWDIGGQWVSSSHTNVLELLLELNLEVFPQYNAGKKLLQLTNDTIKSYSGSIPDVSLPALLDMEHYLRKIGGIAKQINVLNPFDHPKANDLDSLTVENLNDRILWTDTASKLIDIAIETVFGVSPRQMSALYFLTYAASAGDFNKLIETSKGCAQELRVKGGTQQISKLLAEKIGCKNVLLSTPVTKIEQLNDAQTKVTVKNGNVYNCKKVILAIPVPQNCILGKKNILFTLKLVLLEYIPALPISKTILMRNMPIGNLLKFVVVYENAFWREKGCSGEIVNEGKMEDEFEAFDCVFDGTSCNGNPALVGFLSAQRGLWWSDVEPSRRRQAILECLAKFFGNEALAPISFLEKNWYFEPYNGGCPSSICGPGQMEHYHNLKMKFGNLHFAGTETASTWIGYMEGAVESGKRAAKEVLNSLYPDLLSEDEKRVFKRPAFSRRKSQTLRPSHRVFRYTIGLAILAVGVVVLKKMYFRIAL